MGYHVAIMADSTSRWAEALREISGRLEEMPAEEGFPAYLASRLAEFYERAGLFDAGGGKQTSVSIIGAVSPPGGDFSEPVTQHTKRFIRCFWGLDPELAGARHFPAINWTDSYSEYKEDLTSWWSTNFKISWIELRTRFLELLQIEQKLQQVVKLVGPDALPDSERLILEVARIIKIAFLQQNALSEDDAYCVPEKQLLMANTIMHFNDRAKAIIDKGAPIFTITGLSVIQDILRMKSRISNESLGEFDDLIATIDEQMDDLEEKYK